MLRGTSLFICDDCKTIFMGLNIEWNCLPMSATQQCTKCGGWHTMPGRHLDSPDREFYESLWKREDETGNHHVTCAYRLDELEKYWGIMLILGVVGLVITYAYNYMGSTAIYNSKYKTCIGNI